MHTLRPCLHSTQKQPHIARSYSHKETVRCVAL